MTEVSTNNDTHSISIGKTTVMRILHDVKDIIKHPLVSHGIYYEHDDRNILQGQALIIGHSGTPYAHGFYLFTFDFPIDYPHSPPKVTFHTTDGYMRMNPNLYSNGKVCLSVLNTWSGEQWSGCQTISSVLLALCTILTANPLLNEPGLTEDHVCCEPYRDLVRYKNLEIAIHRMLTHDTIKNSKLSQFHYIMRGYLNEHRQDILKLTEEAISICTKYKTAYQIPGVAYINVGILDISCHLHALNLQDKMNILINDNSISLPSS